MPHDNVQLAQAPNGEIGLRCKDCGTRHIWKCNGHR